MNLVVRELSLGLDNSIVEWTGRIFLWSSARLGFLVSGACVVPLLAGSASYGSSSRCPWAVRGRAAWLFDLECAGRPGRALDRSEGALRPGPKLLAKLLDVVDAEVFRDDWKDVGGLIWAGKSQHPAIDAMCLQYRESAFAS